MKIMKTILPVALALLIPAAAAHTPARAENIITRITNNNYTDEAPQIKGNYLVWQEKIGDDWEILVLNQKTGTTTQLTNNSVDDVAPQTDGQYVTWLAGNSSGGEIFVHDLADGLTQQITNDTRIDSPPRIAAGRVVWASEEVTDSVEPAEIMLHDIASGITEQLTFDQFDDRGPVIDDNTITWIQHDEAVTDEEAESVVLTHDIASGITTAGTGETIREINSQSDLGIIVSTLHDGNDWEIVLGNQYNPRATQLTANDVDDTYPHISGNKIAWISGQGEEAEIYLATHLHVALLAPASGSETSTAAPPQFAWRSIGYNNFKIQFSNDPEFPLHKTLTFPRLTQAWLTSPIFTPTAAQWGAILTKGNKIYWRVTGKNNEENQGFTESWHFSLTPQTSPSYRIAPRRR